MLVPDICLDSSSNWSVANALVDHGRGPNRDIPSPFLYIYFIKMKLNRLGYAN